MEVTGLFSPKIYFEWIIGGSNKSPGSQTISPLNLMLPQLKYFFVQKEAALALNAYLVRVAIAACCFRELT